MVSSDLAGLWPCMRHSTAWPLTSMVISSGLVISFLFLTGFWSTSWKTSWPQLGFSHSWFLFFSSSSKDMELAKLLFLGMGQPHTNCTIWLAVGLNFKKERPSCSTKKLGGIGMALPSPTLMATLVSIVTSMAAVGLNSWHGQSLADALQLA